MHSPAPRARARERARGPIRFAAETERAIASARRDELEIQINLNTAAMRAAEIEGHVIELRDHYPGLMLWMVPADLVAKVGFQAAVVRP